MAASERAGGAADAPGEAAEDATTTDGAAGSADATRGRLLVVSQQYPPEMGGNASRVGDTARRLVAEGWDVTVLAPPTSYPPGNFERTWDRETTADDAGVDVHRLWTWQPTAPDPSMLTRVAYYLLFALHATLWTLYRRNRFDAYCCTTPPPFTAVPGLAASAVTGRPFVVDVGDLWTDAAASLGFVSERSLLTRLTRRYEHLVLTRADRVLTTTAEMSEILERGHGPRIARRLTVVPNAVDTARFTPGDGGDGRTVVYTGFFGHAQDLETCVRAMAHVDEDLDARLLLVGDGDLRDRLVDVAHEAGVADRVEFRPPVDRDEVPGLLRSAAVGLATLKQAEGLTYAVPSKTYEYMAAGLPVVATDIGALGRLVEDSGCGVAVGSDPEALGAAYERLLADPDLRAEMGRDGREHVEQRYDRRAVGRHLSDVLAALLAGPDAAEGGPSPVGPGGDPSPADRDGEQSRDGDPAAADGGPATDPGHAPTDTEDTPDR